ncbi:MAG: polysaccharide deacetylase family protein [Clostridia bacterium]|nr:polysaccharide deacetylase family protein [Clostridia bacterium]
MRRRLTLLLAFLLAAALVSCVRAPEETRVPILMYHDFAPEGVSAETFESQLRALLDAGYTAVTLRDVLAYAADGTALPDKPFVVVSDDGYASAVDAALPVAQRLGCPLTVAVIGVSFGRDTYKDTGEPMYPHFGADDVPAPGLCLISHTFDCHNVGLDRERSPETYREGVLRRAGESAADYEAALRADFEKMQALLAPLGGDAAILAYPFGLWSEESETVLRALGVKMTLTTAGGVAVVRRGDPKSVFLLPRIAVDETTDVLGMIENHK